MGLTLHRRLRAAYVGLTLFTAVTAILLSSVRANAYVYEDQNKNSFTLEGWTAWRAHASTAYLVRPRILSEASIALTHSLVRDAVSGDHLVTVSIHLINVIVLGVVLLHLADPLIALMILPLFAWHPIQTETIAYVSTRPDAFVALGLLVSILGVCRHSVLLLISGAAWATFSKEVGVMTWLIAGVAWGSYWRHQRVIWIASSLTVIAGLSVGLRTLYPMTMLSPQMLVSFGAHLTQWLRLMAFLVWPVGLSVVHDWQWVSPVASSAALAAVAILVIVSVRTAHPVLVSVCASLVFLLPRIALNTPEPLHEHHLYASVALVSMGIASWADRRFA